MDDCDKHDGGPAIEGRHGAMHREIPDMETIILNPWASVLDALHVVYLVRLVERSENLSAAARTSGIGRKTLHAQLVRHSLYDWARAQWGW